MTSPDNFVPGGPNTGWDDVGDLADALGSQGILGLLFGGFTNLQAGLNDLVSQIVYGLKGVTGGLIDLTGFILETDQKASDAQTAAEQAQTEVINIGSSIVTVVDTINSVSANPYWVSLNPFEDPSFAVNDLKPVTVYTGTNNTGMHNHSYDGNAGSFASTSMDGIHSHTLTTTVQQPLMPATSGRLYLVPIRCLQDRLYSTAGFVTDGTTGMTGLYAGIFTFDPSTGDATRVWDFGNVKGNLFAGSGLLDQRMLTTEDIAAQRGQSLYVGILAVGGTMPKLGALPSAAITRSDGLHPKAQTLYVDGQSSIPSSIAGSSVQSNLGYQVWACLGQPTSSYDPGAQFVFTESFNRSDGTGYGPSYLTRGNSQGIDGGMASVLGGSDGYRGALRTSPTNTDTQYSEIVLGTPSQLATRAYVRCRSDFSSGACVEATSSEVRIRTFTSLGGGTIRDSRSIPEALPAGSALRISASGNVFTATYEGGSFSWTDTGGAVATGSQCRYVGWGLYRLLGVNSSKIDSWVGRDY
ncbi:hypothetical protein [Rhodococcus sp. USK13]|uniref:DUF7257 domain-containing protein n=1 Tax=Rhodococcus sp. USK13 TaxID=2806442 RepID=UPI001BCEB591|nr:hypothetical protein [Rhodococcus sp. USK13]